MIKKTIEYVDYNGTERSEDFYFNLTEAECIDLEIGTSGGYTEMIRRMVNAKDLAALIKVFRDFISNAFDCWHSSRQQQSFILQEARAGHG